VIAGLLRLLAVHPKLRIWGSGVRISSGAPALSHYLPCKNYWSFTGFARKPKFPRWLIPSTHWFLAGTFQSLVRASIATYSPPDENPHQACFVTGGVGSGSRVELSSTTAGAW